MRIVIEMALRMEMKLLASRHLYWKRPSFATCDFLRSTQSSRYLEVGVRGMMAMVETLQRVVGNIVRMLQRVLLRIEVAENWHMGRRLQWMVRSC